MTLFSISPVVAVRLPGVADPLQPVGPHQHRTALRPLGTLLAQRGCQVSPDSPPLQQAQPRLHSQHLGCPAHLPFIRPPVSHHVRCQYCQAHCEASKTGVIRNIGYSKHYYKYLMTYVNVINISPFTRYLYVYLSANNFYNHSCFVILSILS